MNVTVIAHKEHVALVEYSQDDMPKRVWVPSDKLNGNKVSKDVVRCGVEYGLPWELLLSDSAVTPNAKAAHDLARILRLNGIWTLSDVTGNTAMVQGVVRRITSAIVANLIRSAQAYYFGM